MFLSTPNSTRRRVVVFPRTEKLFETQDRSTSQRIMNGQNTGSKSSEMDVTINDADKEYINDFVKQIEEKLKERKLLRTVNLVTEHPDDSYFATLDQSVKKNTAFMRKLKHYTALQTEALITDIKAINLTKYISEVAVAIVEVKLKVSDVNAAVQLCGVLHCTYADFATQLLANWRKALMIKKDEKILNASKLRVDLRFFTECITAGIFTNEDALPILSSVLTRLINYDKKEHNNINLILNFCKHCGHDFAGLIPTKAIRISKELGILLVGSDIVTEEYQKNVKKLLKDYSESIYTHFIAARKSLANFIHENKMILQYTEELTAERKATLEQMTEILSRLRVGVENFAEVLDEVLPHLPDNLEEEEEDITLKIVGVSDWDNQSTSTTLDLWEDEEMRRFYEELPDLTVYVLKKDKHMNPVENLDDDIENQEDIDPEPSTNTPGDIIDDIGEPAAIPLSKNKSRDLYFAKLANCINRDLIDKAATDFVLKFNSKANRKLLIDRMCSVSWTRLDLLPFYSRLIATLHPVLPEIGTSVSLQLKKDFKIHLRKKDQLKPESKIKTMRYISELVKFGVYSKIEAMFCLRLLLQDFIHHHIEMCCHLFEGCGRYLFRHPVSRVRTEAYLEQMMRMNNVMTLDPRHKTMIENAYYYVNPPTSTTIEHRQRPPMHKFIRHLIYSVLDKHSVDYVLAILSKVDWKESDEAAYAIKCLSKAHNVKYYNIRYLAELVNGLVRVENSIGVHIVDNVLEDIHVTTEMNLLEQNQHRIAMMKYLGELYNYCLVDNIVIFNMLYFLVSLGVSYNPEVSSPLDPPDNFMRVRLITVLLDSCGSFFEKGLSGKKLDYFMVFYQNYYWARRSNPVWSTDRYPTAIELMYVDSLLLLRPELRLCQNYNESCEAVEKLKSDLIAERPDVYKVRDNFSPLLTIEEEGEEDNSSQIIPTSINTLNRQSVESCQEDNNFMLAFDQMVSDNLSDRLTEQVKQVDISVPFHIKNIVKQTENVASHAKFVLLTKKGNKQTYKQLAMPIDSEIVAKIKQTEELERIEMESVKQLTLDINKRMGDEEERKLLEQEALKSGRRVKFVKIPNLVAGNKLVFGSSC